MFTNIAFNNPNWLQQVDYEPSIFTRPVIVRFSFGSRSLLVRSSFVSRSSLVRYSLVYRRPIEDRTRNKRKTNERATRLGRESIEKPSKTRRETAIGVWQTFLSELVRVISRREYFCPVLARKKVKILQSSKDFVLFQGKMSVISKKNGFKGSEIEKNKYLCSC